MSIWVIYLKTINGDITFVNTAFKTYEKALEHLNEHFGLKRIDDCTFISNEEENVFKITALVVDD